MKRASVVTVAAVGVKLFALTVFLFAMMALSASALGVASVEAPPPGATGSSVPRNATGDEPGIQGGQASDDDAARARQLDMALVVLAVCFLQAAAVAVLVVASRWSGWRLVVTVFAIGFMMSAVLPQLESFVFLPGMSRALIGGLVLSNAVTWAFLSPLAVWLLGRRGQGRPNEAASVGGDTYPSPRPSHSMAAWSGALVALGALHILLYFPFGYYIAWRTPELASFYGGEDPGTFFLQLREIARDTPWLYAFQFGRGVLWGLLAVPVAIMVGGPRLHAVLVAGVVFGILMPSQLLFPNPFMPDAVRWAHFWETLLSRLSFGFAAVWLLRSSVVSKPTAAPVSPPDTDSG
jgi:hypothetical protein